MVSESPDTYVSCLKKLDEMADDGQGVVRRICVDPSDEKMYWREKLECDHPLYTRERGA